VQVRTKVQASHILLNGSRVVLPLCGGSWRGEGCLTIFISTYVVDTNTLRNPESDVAPGGRENSMVSVPDAP
jgi:hypothetical protein